jgi:hypothetical protein
VGREERPTPQGVYRVQAKTENPTWVIPESIRREHIRESGDYRRSIPGGDPDNPLGNYRLTLSKPRYAIHGTNIPWGPGMPVSHGCVRLFPEDIKRVYPVVPVGARVELTYQPVKIGQAGGRTWVEVHEDVYARMPLTEAARQARRRQPDRLRRQARQEVTLQRFTAVTQDAVVDERVLHVDEHGHARIDARQLFHDEHGGEEGRASATEVLRDLDAHQPELEELRDQRWIHLRVAVHVVAEWRDRFFRELADRVAEHLLFFGEQSERQTGNIREGD